MAAPLSGVGQQQAPVTQSTVQPGISSQTQEVRSRNQEPQENRIQARNAATGQTLQSNQDDGSFSKELSSSSGFDIEAIKAKNEQTPRGSYVDITV